MVEAAPLLIDVACLCDHHTDDVLELMHKAIGEDPPGGDIWAPVPNPFVARIVELFTQRGLDRIAGLRDELQRWLSGGMHHAHVEAPLERPAGAWERWDAVQLGVTRLYLENLPPDAFTLDDWLLVVDYLAQRYLPATDMRAEADWLASRSSVMGRVQAALGAAAASAAIDRIVFDLSAVAGLGGDQAPPPMTVEQAAALSFGRARCAEHVTSPADAARHRMRNLIVDYQEARFLGDRAGSAEALQSRLLDAFGTMNRDWRRIAVTEATENVNQGFVAACAPGTVRPGGPAGEIGRRQTVAVAGQQGVDPGSGRQRQMAVGRSGRSPCVRGRPRPWRGRRRPARSRRRRQRGSGLSNHPNGTAGAWPRSDQPKEGNPTN